MNKKDKIAMVSGCALFALTILIVVVWAGGRATECHHTAPETACETRTVKMRITAYCPEKCCCGAYADGITASGHKIKSGDKFIAAPKSIPFGTWITVVGYGYAEVLDRGGAIKGNRLDVYFGDKDGVKGHQRALNWGVKWIEVEL